MISSRDSFYARFGIWSGSNYRLLFTWIATNVLKNLLVPGTVSYVRSHLRNLLSIFGKNRILLQNVLYVVAQLGLLGKPQMGNGYMLYVLRWSFLLRQHLLAGSGVLYSVLNIANNLVYNFLQWSLESTFRRGQMNPVQGMVGLYYYNTESLWCLSCLKMLKLNVWCLIRSLWPRTRTLVAYANGYMVHALR